MAKKPAADADVYLMPHEKEEGATSEDGAAEQLDGILAFDPEFGMETPVDDDEPEVEGDEPEADEPEDDEDDADEADSDEDEGEESEDDEDADDSEEAPDAEAKIKVKVDGEEIEVTLDELTKGYSRTADYTRKTQALAEQRRTFEAEQAQTHQAREQYAQGLKQLEVALQQIAPKEPDWDKLQRENPTQFAAQWAAHQRHQADQAAVRAERERVEAEQRQYLQRQQEALINAEREKLQEALPELADPEKGSQLKAALKKYALEAGYTESDLDQVYDHRIMVILDKARRFDELKVKGKQHVAEKKKTAKVIKPGAPKPPAKKGTVARQRAMKKLARSGRVEHAADAIMGFIDD